MEGAVCVAHRDGGKVARGTCQMPKSVVSGGGGRACMDMAVVQELTAGLRKATGLCSAPGLGVEWNHGVNVDKSGRLARFWC
jgi:hypothetical protein